MYVHSACDNNTYATPLYRVANRQSNRMAGDVILSVILFSVNQA